MDVYSGVCVSMLVRIFLDVGEIMCICMEGKHRIYKEPQIQPPCTETEENIISWARQILDCFGAVADIKELEILFLLREKHKHNPLMPEWENESWREDRTYRLACIYFCNCVFNSCVNINIMTCVTLTTLSRQDKEVEFNLLMPKLWFFF